LISFIFNIADNVSLMCKANRYQMLDDQKVEQPKVREFKTLSA